MKFKKYLLTLATPLVSLVSLSSIACAQPTKDNKETNQPNTPKVTPITYNENMTLNSGENSLKPLPISKSEAPVIINLLSKPNAIANYDYRENNLTIGGTAIATLVDSGKENKLQLADAEQKTYVHTNGNTYPNAKIKVSYNPETKEVTLRHYVAHRNPDKSFLYSDNVFTTRFILNVPNDTSTSKPNTNNNVDTSHENTNTTIAVEPVEINNYRYDASNKYYEAANGLKGKELLDKLLEIQSKYRNNVKEYKDIPIFYKSTDTFRDKYYEKDNTFLDIYSENPNGADPYNYTRYDGFRANEEGEGTNREHLIPQSWFGKEWPMHDDIHHIFPTDIKVNALRSSFPHGIVETVKEDGTSQNGSKLGFDHDGETVFEPIDAFKGDIARAYLYFTVTYSDENLSVGRGNQSSNDRSVFTRVFPYIKPKFLNIYLNWNAQDKVSEWDIYRNQKISEFEGGLRNPFIDYPNLAESIFGSNPKPFVNKGVLVGINK
ncbi:endonuclease [Mycoplasma sp. Pen4]|uniref:endonuclease n=1 Tax=Mycoplasma sp. Pen4 TaxID=640330 RepID=UPI0016540F37|nr:endonuclease [Mycoplasma sp. Pen4]QNM93685.1 endonuclease [Mycoplasma sp. Pen4]